MNTDQGHIILKDSMWREAKQPLNGLQPAQNTPLTLLRQKRGYAQPQREKLPSVTDFAPLVNRWLVDVLGDTMRQVEPLESYGRIVLTRFTPSSTYDPILPVPLVRFTGWGGFAHKWAWKDLAWLLVDLEAPWQTSTRRFVYFAKRRAKTIIKHSESFLRPDEHRYYSNQIWESVANPTRKDWKQNNRR